MRDMDRLADVVVMTVKAAMVPLLERLATTEAKMVALAGLDQALTGIRERLVAAETKAAMVPAPTVPDALLDRVAALEGKSFSAPPDDAIAELRRRVDALEQRPAVASVASEDVTGLRDRLVAVETKAHGLETQLAAPDPLGASVEKNERALVELGKELGAIRERLAVVEVRQPTPGPQGPAGADGKDGADGLGFDDLMAVQNDDRSLTVKAARGERVKDIGTIRIPAQIQRGVWVEGKSYELGDLVTWGGSQWHANAATSAKPGEDSKAWTLVVKRGRDGRDGKDAPGALPVVSVTGAKVAANG